MNILDILNDSLFNLDNFGLIDNLLTKLFDWDDLWYMNSLDYDSDNLFRHSDNPLLNNWNFNSTINNLFDLYDLFNYDIPNDLNFFDLNNWH